MAEAREESALAFKAGEDRKSKMDDAKDVDVEESPEAEEGWAHAGHQWITLVALPRVQLAA